MAADPRLRDLPSVDRIVSAMRERGPLLPFPRRAATMVARDVVGEVRRRIRSGGEGASPESIFDEAAHRLRTRFGPRLRRVINASGIILHTNLGRAPLSIRATDAVSEAAAGYSALEVDLSSGERGSRHAHIEHLLTAVSGAQAGFAVNNAAGAVALALAALGRGGGVAVARGELVEIGGGFRLPEVMAASGAQLLEVGTANRTYLSDYRGALDAGASLLLKVHRSNFTLSGFVHDTHLADLVALGSSRQIPVVYDLGSGCLVNLGEAGLPAEPTVQEAVATGADLVIFSGDKLMGGPQAGVVVGQGEAVGLCRAHPLARAVRIDKLDLAALAATLDTYLDPERAWREIPILRMLAEAPSSRRRRATALARTLSKVLGGRAQVSVIPTSGEVGGGALPGCCVASYAASIRPAADRPGEWAARLRAGPTPVIATVRDDALVLDVLALLPGERRLLPSLVGSLAAR